jgi:hypothetical protein
MPKKKTANTFLLLNSEENILSVLEQSNEYLTNNKQLSEKISEFIWIYRSLTDLVPETVEKFGSGHIFPLSEAEYELESSVAFCKLGFYKHAMIALRNVLELGLLSVYWDVGGQSHLEIQNWLKSGERTPFKKNVFKKLRTHPNIHKFDDKHKLLDKTGFLYERLSNFAHTKGMKYSSRGLGKSNINTFDQSSLHGWQKLLGDVIEVVVIFHLLIYPIGFQNTPMHEKFGLNGPAGGFLEPFEVERIKRILDIGMAKTLQEISDNDEKTKRIVQEIDKIPDITTEQFYEQVLEKDKREIAHSGYDHWHRNQLKSYAFLKREAPSEYEDKKQYIKTMRKWAKANGFLTSKDIGEN